MQKTTSRRARANPCPTSCCLLLMLAVDCWCPTIAFVVCAYPMLYGSHSLRVLCVSLFCCFPHPARIRSVAGFPAEQSMHLSRSALVVCHHAPCIALCLHYRSSEPRGFTTRYTMHAPDWLRDAYLPRESLCALLLLFRSLTPVIGPCTFIYSVSAIVAAAVQLPRDKMFATCLLCGLLGSVGFHTV